MKITAVVLTFNPIANGRNPNDVGVTLDDADEVVIVDNGSTEAPHTYPATVWTQQRQFRYYSSTDSNTTSGHGTNLQARIGCGTGADIVVLSDDDMYWRPGWRAQLEAWWSEAPEDIWITGCHLEPLYGWNALHPETETYGGVTGLIRNSTGAASWSFRASDWPKIGPVPEKRQGWGDVPTCQKVRENGGRIAQLDLAEHRGLVSTWGNQSSSFTQEQVAPVRAKLGA